jgi:hypothetical protein
MRTCFRPTQLLTQLLMGILLSLGATNTWAHFVWVILPEPGSRQFGVVLSEGLHPDDPAYLAKIADATVIVHGVDGQRTTVALAMADDRLVGTLPDDFDAIAIEVPVTWGVMNRGSQSFLLKYRALGVLDLGRVDRLQPDSTSTAGPLLLLSRQGKDMRVRAAVGSDVLPETAIKIVGGSEPQEITTDANGSVTWTPTLFGEWGLYAKASVAESGNSNGQSFGEVRTYVTVSVRIPQDNIGTGNELVPQAQTVPAAQLGAVLPELPCGLTSFGAARIGDSIYVYGGHTGTAHRYWNTSQSNQLLRWDLNSENGSWEVVSEGAHRLQGLAMVAHGKRLILVGGFFATNEEGEPHQLFSQDQVTVFDTDSHQWSELPQLPSGRSSHDAIVLDNKLYVVGGWNMTGPDSTHWHESAVVLDLSAAMPTWQELPDPGFQRRALALAAFEGCVYAIGGMEQDGAPTRKTSVFDPATQQWSAGPELLGMQDMVGFGAACWPVNNRLVATTYDGSVQVLSGDRKSWQAVGRTEDARFFHRMLPFRAGHLVLIGGASMESGKFLQPEVIRLHRFFGVER